MVQIFFKPLKRPPVIKTALSQLAERYQSNSLSNQLSISLLRVEILAGLTVAIALVPEAVALLL